MGSSGFNWKLADHPKLPKGKTVGLIFLDGWGEANPDQYNCIHVAETPVMDSFKKAGGEMLAELVGITLGPKGRNVVLQNKYGPPKIVNDGETVLKQIELEDPVENVGVKLVRQAGAKTNDLFRTLFVFFYPPPPSKPIAI